MDLPKIRFDDGFHLEMRQQWRRRLERPLKGGDIDRRDLDIPEPIPDLLGLPMAMFGERRVALAIDERKRLSVFVGRGLTMANEEDFGRSWWCLKRSLSVFHFFIAHCRERSSGRCLMGSFALTASTALAWSPYVTPHRS